MINKNNVGKSIAEELKSLLFPLFLLFISFRSLEKYGIFRAIVFINAFVMLALIFKFKNIKHSVLVLINIPLILINIVICYLYWDKHVNMNELSSSTINLILIIYLGVFIEIVFSFKVNFFRNRAFASAIVIAPALILFAISIYIGQSNLYIFPAIIFALIIFLVFSFKEQKTEKD